MQTGAVPATTPVLIEPRATGDLPALVEVLAEQQPASRYPFRWPLPFPVEDFLVREHEEASWVARAAGRPIGHVSVSRVAGDMTVPFEEATGCPAADLALVTVLFVATGAQGSGVGGRLLDTAVAWARERARLPVLDVVQAHGRALGVYRHRGWEVVGEMHPAWLPPEEQPLLLMRLTGEAGIGPTGP